jgi:hypothetical protein
MGHFRQRFVFLVQSGRSTWRGSLSRPRSSAAVGRRNSSSQARMRASSAGARHLKKSHPHLLAQPAVKYPFEASHCGDSPVTVMCHVLEVSVSGSSAWHKREPSQHSREDAALAAKVETAFEHNRGVYGSPRIQALIAGTRNSMWSKTCSSPHAGTGHLRSAPQTSHRSDAP